MNPAAQNPQSTESWKLLLAGVAGYLRSGGPDLVQTLSTASTDWETVLDLADRHGVASLLHDSFTRCSDVIPAAVALRLRMKYERNIHTTLLLARELIRILACVEALGLEAIPYKGIVLAESCYGDMAMRPSGDLDLFIRAEDLPRIKRAMIDLGYSTRLPIAEQAEAAYAAAGYECTFDSTAGKNLLELQWNLQPRYYAVDYDMRGLFDRAQPVTTAGRHMKTPSPEDLLLVLSLHAAKHVWGRLIWLCDLAQVMKRGDLNWVWIQARACELGIERILHITLVLIHRLLNVEIPAAVAQAVSADRAAHSLAGEIAASMAAGTEYEEEKISYFRLMMRLRERPADRLRFLTRLAFTPGPGEWEVVKFPKPLFGLYRIVRLARLCKRFAG